MGLNEGKPTLWINNKYVSLLQIRNEMGRRRAAALQLIRFKFRGKIISCSSLLIGQPYAPPILYNMDSEGEDNATHGIGNGILLPHVMRFNAPLAAAKLSLIAGALGCGEAGDDADLAIAGADAVAALLARTGHPLKLSEAGVTEDALEHCAGLALTDGATMTNPRAPASTAEIVTLYQQAL